MNKDILKYKEDLIRNGFLVFDENGKIKDIITKSEIVESIKKENSIIDEIDSFITDEKQKITGNINLVKNLNSLAENSQFISDTEIVQIEIHEENLEIQEYVNLNDFATELQNNGYTFGIISKEEETESKRDKLKNKINNKNPLKGYQIVIIPKTRIIEESGRNR